MPLLRRQANIEVIGNRQANSWEYPSTDPFLRDEPVGSYHT